MEICIFRAKKKTVKRKLIYTNIKTWHSNSKEALSVTLILCFMFPVGHLSEERKGL